MSTKEYAKVVKYVPPTKFEQAPYATLWVQIRDDGQSDIYIQMSEEEAEPNWQKMGWLLEQVFDEFIEDPKFIRECLNAYKEVPKSYVDLARILNMASK